MLWDFAQDFAANGEPALRRLQALLLDGKACLNRVAFLDALAEEGTVELPELRAELSPDSFIEEIGLICEMGLMRAYREGILLPERIARLQRFTCDPDALLAAHRRLVEEADAPASPQEAPTASGLGKDDTGTQAQRHGFTTLARAGHLGDLEDRLRPWLPFLLRRVGLADNLDDALARQFLAYLRTRIEEVQQRRFRDLLPGWLRDFARQQNRSDQLQGDRLYPTPAELEADAIERVLRHAGERESAWAKAFRESALRAQVKTGRELLSFEPAEAADIHALPNYRRDLFREARQAHGEGLEVFELQPTA
jgi:hypothetical protein